MFIGLLFLSYASGTHFCDRLGDLLIKHLRMGNEKEKIESLIVSAHLISGTDNILLARINSEITSAVRSTLQDSSLKVGTLENPDKFSSLFKVKVKVKYVYWLRVNFACHK